MYYNKSFFALGTVAFAIISCKNDRMNHHAFNLEEFEVSLASTPAHDGSKTTFAEASAEINCTDTFYHKQHSFKNSKMKISIIQNQTCSITITSVKFQNSTTIYNLTPKDSSLTLTINPPAGVDPQSESNVVFKDENNKPYYANYTINNAAKKINIYFTEDIKSTSISKDKLTSYTLVTYTTNFDILEAPKDIKLNPFTLTYPDKPEIHYNLMANTPSDVPEKDKCIVVSKQDFNQTVKEKADDLDITTPSLVQIHKYISKSEKSKLDSKQCPNFYDLKFTKYNWDDFANSEQFIIISANKITELKNSYKVIIVEKLKE